MIIVALLFVGEIIRACDGISSKIANEKSNYPFNKQLYEDVLDPDLCQRQLEYISRNNTFLLLQFRDASARIPRGFLLGNFNDFGNYDQCLNINGNFEELKIQGKYCITSIAENENLRMNSLPLSEWFTVDGIQEKIDEKFFAKLNYFERFQDVIQPFTRVRDVNSRIGPGNSLPLSRIKLAFCIPAACNINEAFNAINFNFTDTGMKLNEEFCRFPNDKPWVPADYVAMVIFSLIGILVVLSTCYDLWQSFVMVKDPTDISIIYTSFSAYTNIRRLLTFKSGPDTLDCLDGVRALSMAWVVIGHTIMGLMYSVNPLDGFQWLISRKAVWVTAAPISVDTFFMLSGLLVVYTTAGKLSSMQLLRNIPLFYLSRLLRMFPVLAAIVLYKVSIHNRIADGPNWVTPAMSVLNCREYWWAALLHIQNYYNPRKICIAVTWYLSVDVQLHILSPIILVWVLTGRKNIAWIALTAGLLATLGAATAYNFVNNFIAGIYATDVSEVERYQLYYYINTLTRSSPFLVGMVFGYILHLCKGKTLQMNKVIVIILWCLSLLLLGGVSYCVRLNLDENWDSQLGNNLLNSFMRPAWALGLGWVIFACAKGHGGPVNWFLCLHIWKLLARLSYAMYLIHLTIIISAYSASSVQNHFTVLKLVFDAIAFFFITTAIAFVVTVTIDAPFATLFKLVLNKGNFIKKIQNVVLATKTPEVERSEHDHEVNPGDATSKRL